MKKNLGVVQAVYPMPVLMVAAYDENGKVNVMNAAWGMICNEDRIALFIDEDHKTTQNLLKTKAFTVSLADKDHIDVADFFGIATGNKMDDKFERTGYTAIKSEFVNAPIVEEFPVVIQRQKRVFCQRMEKWIRQSCRRLSLISSSMGTMFQVNGLERLGMPAQGL